MATDLFTTPLINSGERFRGKACFPCTRCGESHALRRPASLNSMVMRMPGIPGFLRAGESFQLPLGIYKLRWLGDSNNLLGVDPFSSIYGRSLVTPFLESLQE